jgi:hypothetical protein
LQLPSCGKIRVAEAHGILTDQKPIVVIFWRVQGELKSLAEQSNEFNKLQRKKFKQLEGGTALSLIFKEALLARI